MSSSSKPTGRWLGRSRFLWSTRRARRDGDLGAMLQRLARHHSSAVGVRLGRRGRVLLVLEPQLVGELLVSHAGATTKGSTLQQARGLLGNGLLTSEGDEHRRVRRLVAPAFAPSRLSSYTETFSARTTAQITNWQDGDHLDIRGEMAAVTLDIVGRTVLGVDISAESPLVREALDAAVIDFDGKPGRLGPPAASAQLTPQHSRVHAFVDEIIARRQADPAGDRADVVSALVAGGTVSEAQDVQLIHDNVITLLLAGHETTANALSWALYLLAAHPKVQRQLAVEVDALGGRAPLYADLARLSFTRAVLAETMRRYPPAWVIGRGVSSEFELGGWKLPVGTRALVSPLLLHHDPRWFPEPAKFDPQRWLDGRQDLVPRYAYLPFGTGPRACIGEQFAWAEAIIVLATIAARWSVENPPAVAPKARYGVTLRPDSTLRLTVRRRSEVEVADVDA